MEKLETVMQFYVVARRRGLPDHAVFPCIRLESDDWNDFGISTLFHLTYYQDDNDYTRLGDTKIMQRGVIVTKLDKEFESLDESYCSLGQDIEFYENIQKAFGADSFRILDALNDVAAHPGLLDRFNGDGIFKTSLLRFSDASKALRQGKKILDGFDYKEPFNFKYSCQMAGSTLPHKVWFTFDKESRVPFRMVTLVGKNGTGKTQYLASLASDLSGQTKTTSRSGTFNPYRPPFGKVIAISYSAFDRFARPKTTRTFSYHYCGLNDEKGLISHSRMIERFLESLKRVKELDRINEWNAFLSTVLGQDQISPFFEMAINDQIGKSNMPASSSGQTILLYVLTEIIASIRDESLLLFDEPEMHLHPNATANLIRGIEKILEKYDSYAILATHSPIILQEIPSDCVFVFEREGNAPIVRRLDIESFGANLSTLTEHVFETREVKANYMEVLGKLAESHPYEEVLELFDGQLSFNAKMVLKAKYRKEQQ